MLTDQVQGIIAQLVTNFIDIAATYPLNRSQHIRSINGDLRALLIVNSAKPEYLSEGLLAALRVLQGRVEEARDELIGKK